MHAMKEPELTRNRVRVVWRNFAGFVRPRRWVVYGSPRLISSLVLFVLLALPCSGCVRDRSCTFVRQSNSSGSEIPAGFGVNIHFTDPRPGEMKMLAAAGFRWVRMDLKWDATESEPGRYDF